MQRYDLVAVTYQVYYTDHEMEEYDEGEWVKHDDAAARIAELEAERDRLAAIVERLPRTADGVAVIAGDRAWTQDPELGATEVVVTTDDDDEPAGCYSIGFGVVQATAYVGIPFCYSTRAAAEAAAKGGK